MLCLRETTRVLGRHPDAEEATQDALLRAWRRWHQCRDAAAPEAWVAQIARHEALRTLARRRAREGRLAEDGEAVGRCADPRAEHDHALDKVDLTRALKSAPARDRALAILHYRGDFTLAALAYALGTPEPTVRVWLHRLRSRLRDEMAPHR